MCLKYTANKMISAGKHIQFKAGHCKILQLNQIRHDLFVLMSRVARLCSKQTMLVQWEDNDVSIIHADVWASGTKSHPNLMRNVCEITRKSILYTWTLYLKSRIEALKLSAYLKRTVATYTCMITIITLIASKVL